MGMNEWRQSDSGDATQQAERGGFIVTPTSDSHFSWIRTRLAADSTLMGWMRLATTLIGFGFTIVQFFERFEGMSNVKPARFPSLPHYLGLVLMFLGVFGLFVAVAQYVSFVSYLHSEDFHPIALKANLPLNKPTLVIAGFLVLFGAAAFMAVLLRLA
jgi:putative membrane protein